MHGFSRAALAAAGLCALRVSPASSRCFVGSRFFPATLGVDDPCIMDEVSLPTGAIYRNGDSPASRQIDISGEFSKRITENFGFSIGRTYTNLRPAGGPSIGGFQNLEVGLKYQAITLPQAEFVLSVGLGAELGRTGNAGVGAERFSTLTPTLFVGKGFGDLPTSLGALRPFAVTGQLGYSVPTRSRQVTTAIDPDGGDGGIGEERNPRFVVYDVTLQYSLPYLRANVVDLGLPDPINRLIPMVEARFRTPAGNMSSDTPLRTTGAVQPGVIYAGHKFQIGLQALIPVNRASGKGPGFIGQLHFYLDDIFPTTIGRPIFTTGAAAEAER